MKKLTKEESLNYNTIAKKLAINYFNISIRPEKTDKESKDEIQNLLDKVFGFNDDNSPIISFEDAAYSRNILIIGAGASKGQIDSVPDGNGAISAIESNLGFNEILDREINGIKVFEKRYRALASHYNKKVYGPDISIEKIKKQLGFEGRLSMLLNFYDKQDVLNQIKTILDFQHLPVRFYEIVAHLFKHRFIDIIINFNFDELLDNAIEDEIGASKYYKIVHDSDCKSMNDIADKNMLRIPIYIKPHGTISSKTSLLFTKEHYIDMSEDMKFLLKSIFMGNIGAKNRIIENFNIMIAGFAMESIELNDILFTQIRKKASEISPKIRNIHYYFFSDKNNEIKDKFQSEFFIWQTKLIDDGKHLSLDEIDTKYHCNDSITLADHFENIYDVAVNVMSKPFKPPRLYLHDALSLLFTKEKIRKIGNDLLENNKESYVQYLKFRFIFHILYELLKWKGKIAINTIIHERAGKYYTEYLNALDEEKRLQQPDIISFLRKIVKLKNINLISGSETIYEYNEFTSKLNGLVWREKDFIIDDFINEIINKMISFSLVSPITKPMLIELHSRLKDSLSDVYDSGLYEITPIFDDPKHVRFSPFPKTQIMATSLTLTYKFYQYSTFKEFTDKWDTLYFASDTATPIFNLHRYCSCEISYLEEISKGNKKIKLLTSELERHIIVDEITNRSLNIESEKVINVSSFVQKIIGKNNISHKTLESLINIHHMALYLKDNIPVFGFYFFKPDAKNRINPIYFESNGKSNSDFDNLRKLKELFERQYNKGKKALKYSD